MTFETRLDNMRDIDVYGLAEGEDTLYGHAYVKWSVSIETRDWGVKSICAYATSVAVNLTIEKDEQEREVEIVSDKDGWTLESEIEFDDDSVSVHSIAIDFKYKTISVN